MMKKITFLLLLALMAVIPSFGQDLYLGYCENIDAGYGSANTFYTPYVTFTKSFLTPYAGNHITKVRIGVNHPATGVYLYFKNAPSDKSNLYRQRVGTLEKGWNEITLETPFDITGNADIAIGYRATFTEDGGLGYSNISNNNGASVYVNSTSKWESLNGGVFCIEAVVEGDNLPQNQMRIGTIQNQTSAYTDTERIFSGVAYNSGANAVTSYTIDCYDNGNLIKSVNIAKNIAINGTDTFAISVPSTVYGQHNLTFTISKVNGADDAYADDNSTTATLTVPNPEFRRRVLCEEVTGLWCGWCPRGLVSLEKLKKETQGWFVPVSIHWNDVLAPDESLSYGYADFYSNFEGAPACLIDRAAGPDLYYGILNSAYQQESSTDAQAAMTTTATWNADRTQIITHTDFYSGKDIANADWYLTFHVVEDSVTGFAQTNYYAGGGNGEMAGWENKSNPTTDFYFMDMALGAFPSYSGEQVVSGIVTAYDHQTHDYTIDVPSDVIHGGQSTHKVNKDNVHVVAVLIDHKSGNVINCFDVTPQQPTGISSLSTVADNVAAASRYTVYDASGVQVAAGAFNGNVNSISVPSHGLFIVKAGNKTYKIIK